MRDALEWVKHQILLPTEDDEVVLLEDGSSDESAQLYFTINGEGYEIALRKAPQYNDKRKEDMMAFLLSKKKHTFKLPYKKGE